MHCDNRRGNWVQPVLKLTKGPELYFDSAAPPVLWRWQEMVAMLDDELMKCVVEGDTQGSCAAVAGALQKCCLHESKIYDHNRCHADKKADRVVEMKYC